MDTEETAVIVDLSIEPECQRYGYKCEMCGEKIPFPQTQCPGCSEEVTWLDRDGHKRANYPPCTPVMKYVFSILGLKYFRTEHERASWETLEKEVGEETIAAWVNWLREKGKGRRLGHKGLRGLHTCITQYGMPRGGKNGDLNAGGRKSGDDAGAVSTIRTREDEWLSRLGKDFT